MRSITDAREQFQDEDWPEATWQVYCVLHEFDLGNGQKFVLKRGELAQLAGVDHSTLDDALGRLQISDFLRYGDERESPGNGYLGITIRLLQDHDL